MVSPTSATPLVQLSHVSKSFGPVQVLKDVSLDMYRGEVLCLAGENGAGKSTLIKILTGAISRDTGQYHIDGQDVGSPKPCSGAGARRWCRLPGVELIARGLRRGKSAHGAPANDQGDSQQTGAAREGD